MIKICFGIDAQYAGGAERFVQLLAEALDPKVFQVSVIAPIAGRLDPWCAAVKDAGIDVGRVPMNLPFRPLDAGPLYRAMARCAPHILHVNMPGPYSGQIGLLAPIARLAGAQRVVATEHLPRVERLWKRHQVKQLAYRSVDRVLTVCDSNVEHLVNLQGVRREKTTVVYNGIPKQFGRDRVSQRSEARDRLGLTRDTIGIGMVGSLIRRKGVATLINAVAGLDDSKLRLYIAGTGEDEHEFKQLVDQCGIKQQVTFMNHIDVDSVEQMFTALDILAVPSFMEGMPYVILEAMACGLPVVASRVDGIPEAVAEGETGFLTTPADVDELRKALARLTGDAPLRAQMGESARLRFEKFFTLDRHVAQMELIYRQLLATG